MKEYNPQFFSRFISCRLASICFLLFTFIFNVKAQKDYKAIELALNKVIDSAYSTYKVPGIIAYVWIPGFEYKKTIGKADVQTDEEMKFNDIVRIGSITKTFVSTIILQLIDEGKFSLGDKLDKFYPEVPNSSDITIREILNMTSGLADYIEADTLVSKSFFYDRLNKFTPKEFLSIITSTRPYFEPGKKWYYSNSNYIILGMIIEKITGNKLKDEIDSRIIKPLRLVNTSFPTSPYLEGQYSHGYMKNDTTSELMDVTVMDPSITWAAGAMISNADDLKIWAEALGNGVLISTEMQQQRLQLVNIQDNSNYGLGIFSINGFIGHSGDITGYNSSMFFNPEEKTGIVVFVNEQREKEDVSGLIFYELARVFFPEKK